jgi:vacuolar-type H+-ATPase subunit I/STV1
MLLTNRGSVLGKIKYSFALPDVRILEYVGLNQESIDALQDTNVAEIELVIKSEPRHPLSADTNVITKVINSLRQVCENQRVKKLSANGKTVNSAYQDYKFEERKISNSIDVELDKTVSGKIISKTPSELAEELFIKMRQNYLTNRTDIIRFANREEFYNE